MLPTPRQAPQGRQGPALPPPRGCNPRYPTFRQQYYTAGDEQQLYEQAALHGVLTPAVVHQLRYVFHLLKRGVLVHIRDSRVSLFCSFNKNAYVNDYAHLIEHDPAEYPSFEAMCRYIDGHTAKKSQSHDRVLPRCAWVANGGLVRYDARTVELDKGLEVVRAHLERACATHTVHDCVFILNPRDFPIVHAKGMHPYVDMFEGVHLPAHQRPNDVPVLSMTTSRMHRDIPIPTWDEQPVCTLKPPEGLLPLLERKPMAVFRGSSTGLASNTRNPRLRILELARQHPGKLDAGITYWNMRPRKCTSDKYLRTIPVRWKTTYGTKPFMTYAAQAQFQMIVNLPGHTAAFRLPQLFQLGSVVLHVADHPYKSWVDSIVKPWRHYVPVRSDLADLVERIDWCLGNAEMCLYIAKCAADLAATLDDTRSAYVARVLNAMPAWVVQESGVPQSPFTPLGFYAFQVPGFDVTRERARATGRHPNPTVMFLGEYVFKRITSHEDVNELMVYKHALVHVEPPPPQKGTAPAARRRVAPAAAAPTVRASFRKVWGVHFDRPTGTRWLVLERVQGRSVLQCIAKDRPSVAEVFQYTLAVMELLQAAHDQVGFAHRDCVPWNIVVQDHDTALPERNVRLIDYGKSSAPSVSVWPRPGPAPEPGEQAGEYPLRDMVTLVVQVLYLCMQHNLTGSAQPAFTKALAGTFPTLVWAGAAPEDALACVRRFEAVSALNLALHAPPPGKLRTRLLRLARPDNNENNKGKGGNAEGRQGVLEAKF